MKQADPVPSLMKLAVSWETGTGKQALVQECGKPCDEERKGMWEHRARAPTLT